MTEFPTGTIVYHSKTHRIGVVISPATPADSGKTPVQFSNSESSSHENIQATELVLVKINHSVSPEVLMDAPDIVHELVKKHGPVTVSYGVERFVIVINNDDNLQKLPMFS